MKDLEELLLQFEVWLSVDGFDGYKIEMIENTVDGVIVRVSWRDKMVWEFFALPEFVEEKLMDFYIGFTQCVKHWEYIKEKQNENNDAVA